MKTWKRALALVLALVMALSLVALPSFAEGEEKDTYSVVIKYVFADGSQAAPSWTATLARGSAYHNTVTSPTVVGYTPNKESVELNFEAINDDVTETVTYKPAEVNFTVKHYQQNTDNDNYTLVETETKTGYTESEVGAGLAKSYEGFTALLYDTTTRIAADGSTEVEIYYDRNYYLLSLDLDGGWGADPIYARYGAVIGLSSPTKPGYTFAGWNPDAPANMPAGNQTLKAQWTPVNSVNYTVVFWYENANDDGYSYAGNLTKSAAPGASVSSGQFSGASFTGRDASHFTYNAAKAETVTVNGDGSTVVNVYFNRNLYTVTFKNGKQTLTCGKVEHEHSSACCEYGGTSLSHWRHSDSCCKLGLSEHTHSSRCYTTSDLTITAKYQADIHSNFPIKDGNKTIWWKVPNGTETYGDSEETRYLGSIDIMPGENITFTKYDSESGAKIYYYVETLNGVTGDVNYNGRNYTSYKVIDLTYDSGTSLTYREEFHPITGFTQGDSNPKLPVDGKVGMKQNNYLYYTRNSYTLKFYNYDTELTSQQKTLQYEAPLKSYSFTPAYPSNLEANAYEFAGWYTTPGCFDGSEVKWDTDTMPAGDLMLYAKWAPKTHTVRTYLTEDAMKAGTGLIDTWENVPHRSTIEKPQNPTNGQYTFVGWFYQENGVEKAFDFSMAVTKDLNLYAKWISNSLVQYTIHYQLEDGTTIAPDTTGSALAGATKTFDAKTGTDLNEGYQTGYFPNVGSHSITMDINGGNEFTFVYVPKAEVNYTVRYLEKDTNKVLHEEKHAATRDAVVTEKFETVVGYAPDAYQKRLVLSVDEKENVITFWYVKDTEHAPVQIIHWVQNIAGDGYTEYSSSTNLNGLIGETYTAEWLTIAGFAKNETKSNTSGKLTAAGLVLNLYYDRIEYPYEFRFVNSYTGEDITDYTFPGATKGNARFGDRVTYTAPERLGDLGYKLDTAKSSASQAIDIRIEDPANVAKLNVKTFYYIPYFNVVHVQRNPATENVTRTPNEVDLTTSIVDNRYDLTAQVAAGYLYGGSFSDAACTVVQEYGAENPTSFTPTRGVTYYIWEVRQDYLHPFYYRIWKPVEGGQQTVSHLYMMAPLDRLLYSAAGFTLENGEDTVDYTVQQNGTDVAYGTVQVDKMDQFYQRVYVCEDNGQVKIKSTRDQNFKDYKPGYIAFTEINATDFDALIKDSKTIKYTPYWVTLDGVKVTSVDTKECSYTGGSTINTKNIPHKSEMTFNAGEATTLVAMSFVPVLTVGDTDKDQITVTIHENGDVRTVDVQPGDLTGELAYTEVAGKLFAGFFQDEACTVPADFSDVQEDITVYAKYVSDSYLQVKYTEKGLFRVTGVNLFSAVSSGRDFAEVGILVNDQPIDTRCASRYLIFQTARTMFGLRKSDQLVIGEYSLRNADNGIQLVVTPYWVTLDGTTVTGTQRTLTYTTRGIRG